MSTNNIGVIGIGKLGLSFALLAEHCGYRVMGCDNRNDYMQKLIDKEYASSEPFINEYLQQSQQFIPTSFGAVVYYNDVLFCFVATPSLPDGSYDHSAIDKIVADLQELHVQGTQMDNKILVIGCTTMPGYCDTIQSRLDATGISVVYNPEFIAQGSIIQGLRFADIVLIGCDHNPIVEHTIQSIYETLMDITPRYNIMSRTAAELTKISINCFLAMKISYTNMIGEIAINTGCENEVNIILEAVGDDSRIGHKYLKYGFGFGGPCIPRDQKALGIHAGRVGTQVVIPKAIDNSNALHAEYLKSHYIKQNPDKTIPFIFTQLTYKKGVDMLVESQQYRLCRDLLEVGYSVDITESATVIVQVQQKLSQYSDRITYGAITNGYKINL